MVVELISVGTELLLGNIVNTNAAYLAEKCAGLDCPAIIRQWWATIAEGLLGQYGRRWNGRILWILTGGLGPTQDDPTKETAAGVWNRQLAVDPSFPWKELKLISGNAV